jgi:DNA-directed RNA polymerase subunit RPC12/RpoP
MSDKKDIYTLLNEIYKAYVDKDCQKLRKLLDEAEKVDPANVYLVKYKNLYSQLCGGPIQKTNQFEIKGKPLKYMGKTIKCPHCGAPLIETDYNKKILQDYKAGKINVLKFKCSYCGTEFIWHYTGIKPLFLEDIRVGGEYNIFDRKYKVAGVVQYSGVWEENGEKGNLVYNEYLLYDQRGDIWRFSESVASWPGGKEEEIELSRKSNLSGQIEDITDNYVQINGKKIYFKEKDSVVVKKVY